MKSNIKCEHPVIIANPNLPFLVRNGYSRIVAKDKGFINITSEDIITNKLLPILPKISITNIEEMNTCSHTCLYGKVHRH